jgi:hypothetical protein
MVFGMLAVLTLSACDSTPVVVVATPVPPDARFQTYRHPSGVFRLRLPPDWAIRDVSRSDAIRVEFSPPANTGLPLSVYVVNTGNILDANSLLSSIDRYQTAINGDTAVYTEVSRTAQGDGSWRLTGVRQTPIGPRQLNTFIQADKTFLSAIEVDITGANDGLMQIIRAVINTYRVDPTAVIGASNIQAAPGSGVGAIPASGVLAFSGMHSWTNPQGALIVSGQVTNQSGGPLEGVRVTAILYDAQNNVLIEQPVVVPVEVLLDKTTSAFTINFRSGKPSQAVRYELHAAARNAEYAIKTYLGDDSFIRGNEKAQYNSNGIFTVSGDVVNKTKGLARFVKVTVTVFDEQGRVVATDSAFLSKADLLPGDTGHFEVPFYELGGSAVRFVASVEGKTDG